VPVRVEARGGVSRLLFDRRRSPSAGELTVQSPGYDRAEDRLAVSIDGGASKVTIDDEMPASPAAPARPGPEATARSRPPAGAGGQDEYPTLDSLSPLLAQTSMDDRFRFGLTVILDGMERRLPPGVQKR
jgi:hypothetical protein